MLLFHEVCPKSKIYLLIDGLKLDKGILKYVLSNARDASLVYLLFHSQGYLYESLSLLYLLVIS